MHAVRRFNVRMYIAGGMKSILKSSFAGDVFTDLRSFCAIKKRAFLRAL